ncbi:glutamate receptor ionotropic, kainate 4-like [Homarus americanus]|uniref:glutamate receptor ionotropic, kainate 4-like n=1 Tax=Homarus americanus TaxID=6706 RepID=UPI001C45F443|nr:glutamate receptor ionotropic, kainate 4-like [Homarus americanus]
MGHKFKIVAVSYFPYIDYKRNSDKPGSEVTLKDSLDARLLEAFASVLNFTFQIHEEPNRSWGLENNGIFSGMMGQLQREETDFCTESAPTPERLKAVEYARGYPSDIMIVTSLKPTLLPQYLSLVRPFAGDLWIALLVGVVAWSVIMWVLQRAWWWVAGGSGVKFNTALLYGWGALLEQPPADPSINISGQMLIGLWLLFSLVITTGFRSSLIAHLTVQGTSKPVETLEDILKEDSWRWGTESKLYKGAVIEYFSKHNDRVVKQIHQGLEILDSEKALQKVLDGGYSLIVFKNYISVIVASRYTDARGQTPFFISNKGISVLANLGWGFRKGAPFYPRFSKLMLRLEAAGLTSYWTDNVIARRVRENRATTALDSQAPQGDTTQQLSVVRSQVVLGLNHLQGAFYVLFLGYIVAFLTLLWEKVAHLRSSPQ